MSGSVKREGDEVVIRLPLADIHGLRVALQPIRAGEPTASSTKGIRERLDKALARVESGVKRG